MGVVIIRTKYFLAAFALISVISNLALAASYPITGIVNDAADNKTADGHTVKAYYANDTGSFTTDIIGPNGSSSVSNRYLVEIEQIPGHPVVEVGNVIIFEVVNIDGYIAGPVNITITGDPANDSLAIPAMTLNFSHCPDADNDTYVSALCAIGGNDCNDNNPAITPGANDICGDGIDQDCSAGDLACPTTTTSGGGGGSSGSGGGGGSSSARTTTTVNRTTTTVRPVQTTTIKPTTVPTTTFIVTPMTTTTTPVSRGLFDNITGFITSSPAIAGLILLILIAILILLLQKGMKKKKKEEASTQ